MLSGLVCGAVQDGACVGYVKGKCEIDFFLVASIQLGKLEKDLRTLSETIIIMLHLEVRCHCFYYLLPTLKQVGFLVAPMYTLPFWLSIDFSSYPLFSLKTCSVTMYASKKWLMLIQE